MQKLTIQAPDDWHLHFRDGDMLHETVPATTRCFKRAIAMPNLVPPVTTTELALAYKSRIQAAAPIDSDFDALVTLFLTNETTPEEIEKAKSAGIVASKLYPAGATTNSDAAVKGIKSLYPVFEKMQEVGMLLLIHGEVTDHHIDIFDREKAFIDAFLYDIVKDFPALKVVFEHITTKDAADFVKASSNNVAATITPQHLLLNRNDLLVGGVRPAQLLFTCVKTQYSSASVATTVASGSPKFFLGTDSAPHEKHKKESACGCAGCYSAWSAIELYAQIFDDLGVIDKLEGFASHFGPDFYGLQRNSATITLVKESWKVPELIQIAGSSKANLSSQAAIESEQIVPFYAGQTLHWKLA